MEIWITLSVIYVPSFILLIYSLIRKFKVRKNKAMYRGDFAVTLPEYVLAIGAICDIIFSLFILGFTFFSYEIPDLIFYVVFGGEIWAGIYMILKTCTFRAVVKGEKITVYSAFKRPYTFCFSEIISVVRQVSKNKKKSERLVIKTSGGKKLILENLEVCYNRFVKKIKSEVKEAYLVGF